MGGVLLAVRKVTFGRVDTFTVAGALTIVPLMSTGTFATALPGFKIPELVIAVTSHPEAYAAIVAAEAAIVNISLFKRITDILLSVLGYRTGANQRSAPIL
jgi:hypothetical protein